MANELPMAENHKITEKKIGFREMSLKSVKLAWLPIQNNPKIKKSSLMNSSASMRCGDRSITN